MLGTVASQVLVLEEEVDTQVCLANNGRVLDGEVADAWQHQVLECFRADNAWARVDEQDVRILERGLAGSPPEA